MFVTRLKRLQKHAFETGIDTMGRALSLYAKPFSKASFTASLASEFTLLYIDASSLQ